MAFFKYKRLASHNEVPVSLTYKLAQVLILISLFTIILLIGTVVFYPTSSTSTNVYQPIYSHIFTGLTYQDKHYQDDLQCHIPPIIKIPKSPDGSYTPPAIHPTLTRAVDFATDNEYQDFCEKYDPVLETYTDQWTYNEDGECGNWQEQYTKLHKHNMEMLEKYKLYEFPASDNLEEINNRPKFISYICEEVPKNSNRGCGGLADRMGGMPPFFNICFFFFFNYCCF